MPKFNLVIVEPTGFADPAPVVQTLVSDPILFNRYILIGVIAAIDALHRFATIERHKEFEKQAAVANCLVIIKSDLIATDANKKIPKKPQSKLLSINPTAVFWTVIKEILSLNVWSILLFMTQIQSQ